MKRVLLVRHVGGSVAGVEAAAEVTALRQRHFFAAEGKTLEDYRESDARSVHFVARARDALVGYVPYDPALNRLRQLVVAPPARGVRLGLHLIEQVKAEARRHGHQELLVHAWIHMSDFYRRAGFVVRDEPPLAAIPWQRMSVALG